MWIRVRLDIGWKDLVLGLAWSLSRRDRVEEQSRLEQLWSEGRQDSVACLSVRSAFDLLLSELSLEPGDEAIFSAITIPDMVRVAEAHVLVPVPVDLTGSDFRIDVSHLERVITGRSRVLVVAHLFGARPDLDRVLTRAHARDLFVVEDGKLTEHGTHAQLLAIEDGTYRKLYGLQRQLTSEEGIDA